MSQKTQIVNIYTDGSCRGNGKEKNQGGWAALVNIDEKSYIIGGHTDNTTNNRMELMAVLKGYLHAIRYVPLEANLSEYTFNIYTDSAYIHNCYKQKWYVNWEKNNWINAKKQPIKNKDLWETIIELFKLDNVNFYKVAGHSGNEFNEIVDKMAVEYAVNGGKYV